MALHRVRDLQRYTIGATDGDIGTVDDVYFEDQSWTVRYLVADTGGWLGGRHVLLPPRALKQVDDAGERIVTELSKRQVEDSPGIASHLPVSRQYETDLYGYYGYPSYWGGPYRWGLSAYPYAAAGFPGPAAHRPAVVEELAARRAESNDPNLRSARDVTGHGIQATDGTLGHVEDYLIDDADWAIRYFIVDPANWWPGAHVLVPTDWIRAVHWNDSTIEVNVDKESVRNAPAYDPMARVERDYETLYHRHFGRPGYWGADPEAWRRYPPAA